MDHFGLQPKIQNSRKPMISLVAGGGFVPQSHIDSVQLTDSTIVRNAKKGYKGKSFIQFSFSSMLSSLQRILVCPPLHRFLQSGTSSGLIFVVL
jgi:hypothetical protein